MTLLIMNQIRFMRLVVFFDVPQDTKQDLLAYKRLIKYFKNNGFIMVQYSIYSKLCINSQSMNCLIKELKMHAPNKGSVRYLPISEKQYISIKDVNNKYSNQECITNMDRILVIGDIDDI